VNHGFDNISDKQPGRKGEVRQRYGARVINSVGIKLFVYYYTGLSHRLYFYIDYGDNTYKKFYSFDEFFELLPDEQKEVFLWNIHLLT
jgi:hypothetical protein